MRLWSLHPQYLDSKGLVACWRESLLAKAVLTNQTKGYRNHPQLERFRSQHHVIDAINRYLHALYCEALERGYTFDRGKVDRTRTHDKMTVTSGQVRYEWDHLKSKLWRRDRRRYRAFQNIEIPTVHPLFRIVKGGVESWERL